MIKIISSLLIFSCYIDLYCQDYYYAVFPGDTILLHLEDTNSFSVQWQIKDDTLNKWKNIDAANTNDFAYSIVMNNSKRLFIRAKTFSKMDSCANYSSTIKIHIVNDIQETDEGDYIEGGRVFYKINGQGLVVGTQSYGSIGWGCPNLEITGADSSAVGSGLQNTLAILKDCKEANYAAKLCDTLTLNGFTDWFLPSKDELGLIFNLQWFQKIKFFESLVNYWSSTEVSRDQAYSYVGIIAGGAPPKATEPFKTKELLVCPVRKINNITKRKININAIIIKKEFITDVIVQNTNIPSQVNVFYVGEGLDSDSIEWDFGQGKALSGKENGPILVYYNFEGFNRIKVRNINNPCQAQYFYSRIFKVKLFEETNIKIPAVYNADWQWGDSDNDGFKDLLMTGDDTSALFTNSGLDSFSKHDILLPRLSESSASWGDFDNDSYLDFALMGLSRLDSVRKTLIYRNQGNNTFTIINTNLPFYSSGFIKWIDINNDGKLELILSGEDSNYLPNPKIFNYEN